MTKLSYRYDVNGNKVADAKQTSPTGPPSTSPTASDQSTNYLIDSNVPFAQVMQSSTRNASASANASAANATNAAQLNGTRSYNRSIGGELLAQISASAINGTSAQTLIPLADAQMSARVIVDASNANAITALSTANFEGYGEPSNSETGAPLTDEQRINQLINQAALSAFAYDGEQLDPDTGLIYLRARWYDPQAAKFLSIDPFPGNARRPITLNDYAFASADPVNNVDPSGAFTMGGMMSGIGTMSNLANIAITAYDIYSLVLGKPDDDNADGPFRLWDALMAMAMRSVTSGVSVPSSSLNPLAGAGPTNEHHTVPIYMCGANAQKPLANVSYAGHKQLHAELYGFKIAGDLVGAAIDLLVFRKKFPGGIKTPTQRLARTPAGRASIAAALGVFYEEFDWFSREPGSRGRPGIAGAFAVAGPAFTVTHSYPRCSR